MVLPMRLTCRLPGLVAAVLLGLLLGAPVLEAAPPPRAAVASESATTTREALGVLAGGGNAVDAAVCAALVAGVVSPTSSGLGGGGFALVWLAAEKRAVLLDFRETAPQGVDAAALQKGELQNNERGKLVGTPGELAGLYELHRRHGKTPWAALVERAEKLARGGFAVEQHVANVLAGKSAAAFQRDASLKATFYPAGKPAKLGQRLRRSNLAKTLAQIKTQGPATAPL
jgi:gamma-glutamyltranspeptidase / glutathione hydrolase